MIEPTCTGRFVKTVERHSHKIEERVVLTSTALKSETMEALQIRLDEKTASAYPVIVSGDGVGVRYTASDSNAQPD
jgi:hypothetical protein